jgi:hypothetical protein
VAGKGLAIQNNNTKGYLGNRHLREVHSIDPIEVQGHRKITKVAPEKIKEAQSQA